MYICVFLQTDGGGLSALMPLVPLCLEQTCGYTFFAGFHIEEDKSLDHKMVCVILSNIVFLKENSPSFNF